MVPSISCLWAIPGRLLSSVTKKSIRSRHPSAAEFCELFQCSQSNYPSVDSAKTLIHRNVIAAQQLFKLLAVKARTLLLSSIASNMYPEVMVYLLTVTNSLSECRIRADMVYSWRYSRVYTWSINKQASTCTWRHTLHGGCLLKTSWLLWYKCCNNLNDF